MSSSTRLFRVNPSMDQALRAWGRGALVAASVASALALQGCEVLAIGAVAGGSAAVAVDRRTTGIQLEDKTIEIKVGQRAKERVGDKGNVNATAYNRAVLLTGEVPTEADRAAIERAAAQVENVKGVVNELTVGFPSALTARASDGIIAGKVRARFIEAADLSASAFKITVEGGVVYLMGMVSEAESRRATQLAAGVSGVKKVVRVLEMISAEEVMRFRSKATGTR
jgi:osmotically-inducible protein OsmY